jgi:hypothetical protein
MSRSKRALKASLEAGYGKPKKDLFDFARIRYYFDNAAPKKESDTLSDKTCHDLDFDEVFMFADRTVSKVGQQCLYATLRTIDFTGGRSWRLDRLATLLEADAALRETVGAQLSRLSGKNAYHLPALFLAPHLQPPDWFWVVRTLPFVSLVLIGLVPFYPPVLLLLLAVLTINYGIHYWNKKNLFRYIASIPQLLILKQVTRELLKQEKLGPPPDGLVQATGTLDKVGYSVSFLQLEARMQSEVGQVAEVVTELIKALFLLEPLLLFYALGQLEAKRGDIESVFEYVGSIDVALSVCSLRAGLAYYCKPTPGEAGKQFAATDLYHPLIVSPVANSIAVTGKSVLLTGSNMSGKTTFIRTVGINAILAQTLHTCLARAFTMPPMRVLSAVRITDDLLSDKSYYFEEVLTIRHMIEESHSPAQSLFLLDELFKGTNTIERIAAGKAVLSHLNRSNHLVFVSTHDLELTNYLEEDFDLYHFTEVVEDDKIAFDYKLRSGNLTTRNAIRILELNAYPAEIIREARALSEKMMNAVAKMG